jgi:anti-anti-sigma regulatory factor
VIEPGPSPARFGFEEVTGAHKQAEAEGREALLVVPSATVLRVLALTGMDRVIPIFTSLVAALAYADQRDDDPGLA